MTTPTDHPGAAASRTAVSSRLSRTLGLISRPDTGTGPRTTLRWAAPVVLAVILALAGTLRVAGITDNPPGFFTDEAAVGYNAYTILNHGKDEYGEGWPLLFKSFGDYKLPVCIYSTVPFVAVFGLTELAVRLTSAVYGTLTVLTTYLLAAALFRRRSVGVAAAFFLAIAPWHIHFSRTGFGEMVTFPTFLILGLYLFLRSARDARLWPACGLALGITLYTYRSAWSVLPPLLLLLAFLYRREIIRHLRWALSGLALTVLMGLPLLVHLLYGGGDRSQQVSILNLNLGLWDTVRTFVSHYRSYFTVPFLFEEGDNGAITRHYLPGVGLLYRFQLPFLVLGFLGCLLRPNREKVIGLALLTLYPLAGALSDYSPISTRTILGAIAFSLLAAYGLTTLFDWLRRLRRPYRQAAAGLLLATVVVVAGVSLWSYVSRYHAEYPRLSAGYWGWQAGPKEIVEYFVSVEDSYDMLVMDSDFNSPGMFFRFYAPNDCARCVIGNTDRYDPRLKQLFALKPKNLPLSYTYQPLHSVTYPGGELAFLVVEITGPRTGPSAQ